jgi:hypothetical protein
LKGKTGGAMVYLLTEQDLGKQVEVHVPQKDNPEVYMERTGYIADFDEKYIYVKFLDRESASAELPEWCFWTNGSR